VQISLPGDEPYDIRSSIKYTAVKRHLERLQEKNLIPMKPNQVSEPLLQEFRQRVSQADVAGLSTIAADRLA